MRLSPRQSLKLLKSQKAGAMIGYLMLTMGIAALIYAGKVLMDERGARNWVPHYAEIASAALETHVNDEGGKTYSIDVAYRFDWEGQSYAGNQYRLHDNPNPSFEDNNEIVQDLLETKREQGRYPIFVNPKNPDQSAVKNVVHPKAKSSSLFFGFLFSIFGYFTAFRPKLFRRRGHGRGHGGEK